MNKIDGVGWVLGGLKWSWDCDEGDDDGDDGGDGGGDDGGDDDGDDSGDDDGEDLKRETEEGGWWLRMVDDGW